MKYSLHHALRVARRVMLALVIAPLVSTISAQGVASLSSLDELRALGSLERLGDLRALSSLERLGDLRALSSLGRLGEVSALGALERLGDLGALGASERVADVQVIGGLQDDPADSLFRTAQAALRRGEHQRAAELFRAVRARYPRSRPASD